MTQHATAQLLDSSYYINASIHGSPHLAVTQAIASVKLLSQQDLERSSLGYNSMIQIDSGPGHTPEDLLEFYVISD